VSARHVHAGGAQPLDRRDGAAVDRGRQQRHAGLGESLDKTLLRRPVGLAEAISVADRDAAAEPGIARTVDDQLELPQAQRAAVVEMQVDASPVARSQIEDDVDVPHGVAVHPGGIDTADHLHAAPESLLE
jgi:hypothetical protein